MGNKLESIIDKIKVLEWEWFEEIRKKEEEFFYEIKEKRVEFEDGVRKKHRRLLIKIRHYLRDAAIMNIITAPVIYSCIVPAVFMDLTITLFQKICFPVYGIPQVRRQDYIVLDRHFLHYLNGIEKFNCLYCGYFNGLAGYVREIAGRTEQYWCPIKHARKVRGMHSRYPKFFDFGDALGYRSDLEKVRRSFDDLQKKKVPAPPSGPNSANPGPTAD